jgi:hypothetical protein
MPKLKKRERNSPENDKEREIDWSDHFSIKKLVVLDVKWSR